ncbi:hypothetical protein E4U43_004553 [Claviceps pusilla]|uniref:Uncharacterized protein n=1 Tax=Claviceps pusilla TaxID=123648 RepID=A0A9P7N431_9HYPO|nr:hypothetical protein E4U43_004553 [Claviceps pusilla]
MFTRFLERLRHWIRRVWRHGQTRHKTEPCAADQNKTSNPTSPSPQRETPATEKARSPPRDDLSAPAPHTSVPETSSEVPRPRADSGVDQRSLATTRTPGVHEQLPSTSTQQESQPAVRDTETVAEDDPTSRHEVPKDSTTVDYTTHERTPVVEEVIEKQVHTVYQLERTRSNHIHEHFYHIQPIVDTSEDNQAHTADVDNS